MKKLPNKLILTIGPPYGGHKYLRAYTAWSIMGYPYIGIVLENVCKDIEDLEDINEWANAIDALYLIEFTCANIIKVNPVFDYDYPCEGRKFCPISYIVRKIGYKYEIKEDNKRFIK